MKPDEMRRAAAWLECAHWHPWQVPAHIATFYPADDARALARLLREEADRAPDAERYRKLRSEANADVDGVHVYGPDDDCIVYGDDLDAAVDALPPPPQGGEG